MSLYRAAKTVTDKHLSSSSEGGINQAAPAADDTKEA